MQYEPSKGAVVRRFVLRPEKTYEQSELRYYTFNLIALSHILKSWDNRPAEPHTYLVE